MLVAEDVLNPNIAIEFDNMMVVSIGHCSKFGYNSVFVFDYDITLITYDCARSPLWVFDQVTQLSAIHANMHDSMYLSISQFKSVINSNDFAVAEIDI